MCLSNLILITLTEISSTTPQSLTTYKTPTKTNTKPSAKYSYISEQLKEICRHTTPTSLTSLPLGTITIWELRLNNKTRKIRNKKSKNTPPGIAIQNHRQIVTTDENNDEIVKNIWLSTGNARSIKNKENLISNELTKRKIDILIATKTWLQDTKEDETWTAACELASPPCQIFTKNRRGQRGGGIALIANMNCKVSEKRNVQTYPSFEHNIWDIQLGSRSTP